MLKSTQGISTDEEAKPNECIYIEPFDEDGYYPDPQRLVNTGVMKNMHGQGFYHDIKHDLFEEFTPGDFGTIPKELFCAKEGEICNCHGIARWPVLPAVSAGPFICEADTFQMAGDPHEPALSNPARVCMCKGGIDAPEVMNNKYVAMLTEIMDLIRQVSSNTALQSNSFIVDCSS